MNNYKTLLLIGVVFLSSICFGADSSQPNDNSDVLKEKIESWVTIVSLDDGEIVDPALSLTVEVAYEAWSFHFSKNDRQQVVKPGSFDVLELILDGESVALTELDKANQKGGSISFILLPSDLPEDVQEFTLQVRAYSTYMPLDKLPVQFNGSATEHANKIAAESDVITIQLGIDIEAIRFEAQAILNEDPDGDDDGDSLTNSFEILNLAFSTQPDNADSDNDGKSDAEEDEDHDGLTNFEEQELGTNPLVTDTDSDGLTDLEETKTYGTNPIDEDSDTDGLSDGLEVELGTDPNNPDTDGDSILDGDDSVEFEVTDKDSGITAVVTGKGNIKHNLSFLLLTTEPFYADAPTVISSVEIKVKNGDLIDEAVITIPFDLAMLGDTNPYNLGIAYINPETGEIEPLTDQVIDLLNNTVSGRTTHFSIFILYDIARMEEIYARDFFGSIRGAGGSIVFVFSIDSSGSMSWNDPNDIRKDVSKDLIDSLEDDDKVGIVDLDSSAHILQEITTDKEAAKSAVDNINSSGGTNIGAAVTTANTMLINEVEDGNKIQILLTDGQGSYSASYTKQAADNGIIIYTIGLGSGVDESLLRSIAEGTGGKYYQVNNAIDLISVFQTLKDETKDTDGDGLSDSAEIYGMRTFLGMTIMSDPNNHDTDGDGLSDGQEVGIPLWGALGDYYMVSSNPNKVDTDGDGLNDKEENDLGTNSYKQDTDDDGLNDKLEDDSGTDPLLEDSDFDGLNDRIDPMPNQSDFYGNLEKISEVVAILTVYSDPTYSPIYASENFIIPGNYGSHAFVSIRSTSDQDIEVGKFGGVGFGKTVALGTWGNKSEHLGLWYNLESFYKDIDSSAYSSSVSISYALDAKLLNQLNQYAINHDEHTGVRKNCSYFASSIWNEIAEYKYEVGAGIIIRSPKNLADNIESTWETEHRVGGDIPFDFSVYHANGTRDLSESIIDD